MGPWGGGRENKQRKEVLRSIDSWGLSPTLALYGGLPYFTRIGLKLKDLGQQAKNRLYSILAPALETLLN